MSRFADSSELREAARLAGRVLRPGRRATESAAAARPAAPASAPARAQVGPALPRDAEPDLFAAAADAVEAGVRRYTAAPRGPQEGTSGPC
jgi:hypothetical protein